MVEVRVECRGNHAVGGHPFFFRAWEGDRIAAVEPMDVLPEEGCALLNKAIGGKRIEERELRQLLLRHCIAGIAVRDDFGEQHVLYGQDLFEESTATGIEHDGNAAAHAVTLSSSALRVERTA